MKRTLDHPTLHAYSAKLSTFAKIAAVVALLAVCLGTAAPARAAVTFGASVTNANGTLSTTLTWDAPGASGCTASGHPSWTGAKAASGSLALPPITLSGTYALTIACTKPTVTTAVITWKAPTANSDGTAYTNPKGFRIFYNTGGENMVTATGGQMRQINTPAATTYTVTGLTPGTWSFGVAALNANDVESSVETRTDADVPLSKVITASAVENASVSLTVNPIPGQVSGVAVQ
jgi:hypothetical protein